MLEVIISVTFVNLTFDLARLFREALASASTAMQPQPGNQLLSGLIEAGLKLKLSHLTALGCPSNLERHRGPPTILRGASMHYNMEAEQGH